MNCLFCKLDTATSRSVEHIIPESIGNTTAVLPPGIVCDKCNNYFSVKIEGPLLDESYFRHMRYHTRIRTKKGNPPRIEGIHLDTLVSLNLYPNIDGQGASIGASYPHQEALLLDSLSSRGGFSFIVPFPTPPNEQLLSRLLGKVALEAYALHYLKEGLDVQELVHDAELDPLRDYVRRGFKPKIWPFNSRRLYDPEHHFTIPGQPPGAILCGWTAQQVTPEDPYFILELFGVEYALNIGFPEVDKYRRWLIDNANRSPLHPDGFM